MARRKRAKGADIFEDQFPVITGEARQRLLKQIELQKAKKSKFFR